MTQAKVLDNFEKKLEFLAKNDQQECSLSRTGPIILNPDVLDCGVQNMS